ncbi:hypothetical protein NCAST_32_04420 [Nocardia asteroides NBRC 15531]|uniref:Uncharacterized protein n=1 Tax=Nocardia asteroides NBRC 15531 TaxID=1110697 RepID=U5EHT8_NOCAS|nr:hypothetical protein NCAST_32_04420 [Nocardia asteroides NBRC 15531]
MCCDAEKFDMEWLRRSRREPGRHTRDTARQDCSDGGESERSESAGRRRQRNDQGFIIAVPHMRSTITAASGTGNRITGATA